MKPSLRIAYSLLLGLALLAGIPFIMISVIRNSPDTRAAAETTAETTAGEADASVPAEENADANETAPEEENTEETEEETEEETVEVISFVESDASYFDDALFIGDSRTIGLMNYGTLQNADYFCTGGLSARAVADNEAVHGRTITETLAEQQYGKIYIMLGLNEIAFGLDLFQQNFERVYKIVREAQPNAIIYLEANLHVSASVSKSKPNISNDKINSANAYIESLADNVHSFYIDVNTLFDTPEHCLPENGDGIHVGGSDYARWTDWIRQNTVTSESISASQAGVSFGDALKAVRKGKKYTRKAWHDATIWIQMPEDEPVLQLHDADETLSPWSASSDDLLSEDWVEITAE